MEPVVERSGACEAPTCGRHDVLHQCWACLRWYCRDCMPFVGEACDLCFEVREER